MKINPDYCYTMALVSFLGLFVWLMLWHTLIAVPTALPIALILLLTVSPLLLPMRGLLKGDLRSCAWMAYISLGYILYGAGESYVNVEHRGYLIVELILSLMLFFGTTLYIRFVGNRS